MSSLRPADSIGRFTLLSVRSPPCLPDQANLCFLSPCRLSSVTSPFIYIILLHTHWLTLFPHEASLPVYANIRSTIYTSSWPCLLWIFYSFSFALSLDDLTNSWLPLLANLHYRPIFSFTSLWLPLCFHPIHVYLRSFVHHYLQKHRLPPITAPSCFEIL